MQAREVIRTNFSAISEFLIQLWAVKVFSIISFVNDSGFLECFLHFVNIGVSLQRRIIWKMVLFCLIMQLHSNVVSWNAIVAVTVEITLNLLGALLYILTAPIFLFFIWRRPQFPLAYIALFHLLLILLFCFRLLQESELFLAIWTFVQVVDLLLLFVLYFIFYVHIDEIDRNVLEVTIFLLKDWVLYQLNVLGPVKRCQNLVWNHLRSQCLLSDAVAFARVWHFKLINSLNGCLNFFWKCQ